MKPRFQLGLKRIRVDDGYGFGLGLVLAHHGLAVMLGAWNFYAGWVDATARPVRRIE